MNSVTRSIKHIVAILALLFCIFCLPLMAQNVYAAEEVASGTCEDNLTWVLDDEGTLTISGSGSMRDCGDVTQQDAPWVGYLFMIKKIVVNEGVTKIGSFAFYGASHVNEIVLPSTLVEIGGYAFDGAKELQLIELPEGLKYIRARAFANTGLKSIVFPKEVEALGWESFSYCENLEYIDFYNTNIEEIEFSAFQWCSRLKQCILPKGLNKIGNHAFWYSGIEEIEIPSSVLVIDEGAFAYCESLQNVSIEEGLNTINSATFTGCTNLKSINIPESVSLLQGDDIFTDCTQLQIKVISGSYAELYVKAHELDYILTCKSHTWSDVFTVDKVPTCVNEGSKSIHCSICDAIDESTIEVIPKIDHTWNGDYTVDKEPTDTEEGSESIHCLVCDAVKEGSERVIPALNVIAHGTCGDNLTWVLDKEGLLVISGNGDMYDYDVYKSPWYLVDGVIYDVIIGEGVTSVGDCAFSVCPYINSIQLPNTLCSIGDSAFYYCTELTTITIPSNVSTLENNVFNSCKNLKKVNIPEGITRLGANSFLSCSKLESVTLPESLQYIDGMAFAGCHALETILLPDNVEIIGSSAFDGCGLVSVALPKKLQRIGVSAFSECYGLEYVSGEVGSLTQIDQNAFHSCSKLKSVPEFKNLQTLGSDVFSNCTKLENFYIAPTVSRIGSDVFLDTTTLIIDNNSYAVSYAKENNLQFTCKEHTRGDMIEQIPSTCITNGYTVYKCSICDMEYEDDFQELGAHHYCDWKVTKEATCTEDGLKEKVCEVCGDKVTEKIAATGHTPSDPVKEDEVAATCDKDGTYDEVVYCSVCKAEISRDNKTVAALGHNWNKDYTVDKEATCTEEGSKSIHCVRCNAIDESTVEPISAIGHSYGEPTYIWADDYSTVTASMTCKNDSAHVISETANTIAEVTKSATYTTKGETTYTATFSNEAFVAQTKTIANINILPKVANTLSVKAKTATIKYSKVKKKAQTLTYSKVLTISKPQGTLSYKLMSVTKSKFKKYFSINAKTGKVTIKKGLKKGTYKIKVRVTAAGTEKFKAATKTVTFTVKVK